MRSSKVVERLERLIANAKVLSSISASSDTAKSEGAADAAVLNKLCKKIHTLRVSDPDPYPDPDPH